MRSGVAGRGPRWQPVRAGGAGGPLLAVGGASETPAGPLRAPASDVTRSYYFGG